MGRKQRDVVTVGSLQVPAGYAFDTKTNLRSAGKDPRVAGEPLRGQAIVEAAVGIGGVLPSHGPKEATGRVHAVAQQEQLHGGMVDVTFAIDASFRVQRPELALASFADGHDARVMELLEGWGVADDRWRLGVQAAFARALSVELPDGTTRGYMLLLMPQWVKTRWTSSRLQPAKLYHLGSAGILGT